MYAFVYIYIYTYVYNYIYTRIYTWIYIYKYIYIPTHVHTHTHTHTHARTHKHTLKYKLTHLALTRFVSLTLSLLPLPHKTPPPPSDTRRWVPKVCDTRAQRDRWQRSGMYMYIHTYMYVQLYICVVICIYNTYVNEIDSSVHTRLVVDERDECRCVFIDTKHSSTCYVCLYEKIFINTKNSSAGF